MGKLEVNKLCRKDSHPVQVNKVGPQHDFVHYRKPSWLDAPVNKQTKHYIERLLEVNHDAFADDERQIGTTPLLRCPLTLVNTHQSPRNLMLWP